MHPVNPLTILIALLTTLLLSVSLALLAFGAQPATLESVSLRYEDPQLASVLYSTGDMPSRETLRTQVSAALCLMVQQAKQWAEETGREFTSPLKFPIAVQVDQMVAGGGGQFYSKGHQQVTVRTCAEERHL